MTSYEAVNAVPPGKLEELVLRSLRIGEHLWIATAAWVVANPASSQLILDRENLLVVPGVGCYICELSYSARQASRMCSGKPQGGIPPLLPGM